MRRACGSRSNPAPSRNVCAAGICAAMSAAIRGTRNFARAASSTSRGPVRSAIRMTDRRKSRPRGDVADAVGLGGARRSAQQELHHRPLRRIRVHAVLPVLDITCMHNVGAAFSFLASASGLAALAVHRPGRRGQHRHHRSGCQAAARHHALLAAGLALVLGGALGNVIDRIRLGYVDRFHPLSLGSGVFSGIQRGGFGDHGRGGLPAAGCLVRSRGQRDQDLMQILLANPRGFCAGVDRAIDIVERAIVAVRRARSTCGMKSCTTSTWWTGCAPSARCSSMNCTRCPTAPR